MRIISLFLCCAPFAFKQAAWKAFNVDGIVTRKHRKKENFFKKISKLIKELFFFGKSARLPDRKKRNENASDFIPLEFIDQINL